MRRALLLAALLSGCSAGPSELSPTTLAQTGGELRVRVPEGTGEAGVIVLVDSVAAHATVIEAPGVVRVRVPSLPRVGQVTVELLRADGTRVVLGELEVSEPRFDVRARE